MRLKKNIGMLQFINTLKAFFSYFTEEKAEKMPTHTILHIHRLKSYLKTGRKLTMSIRTRIKSEEGYRKYPYKCTNGKLTIGYGTNLEEGLSREEAESLLKYRLDKVISNLNSRVVFPNLKYKRLPYGVREALADMMYQLGRTRFKKFKKMLTALEERDYETASKECLDSKYYREDSPARAKRNAILIKKG